MKKVELGTRWSFEVVLGVLGTVYAVDVRGHLLGVGTGSLAFRVAPHPAAPGRWTADRLPVLGPWECFVDGPWDAPADGPRGFATPEEAARALVETAEALRLRLAQQRAYGEVG